MEVDAVKPDVPTDEEHEANYWRERAECLEEWVCELLRKNQALRMNREKEETIHRHREGMTATFSLRGVYQPSLASGQPEFRTGSPNVSVDADPDSCAREECAEIRGSLIQNAVMKRPASEVSKLKGMKQTMKPFQRIIVAYDGSPAAREALSAGIEICKLLDTPLETITVIEPPPAYTAFVVAVDPGAAQGLESDRREQGQELIRFAIAEGRRNSVEVTGHLIEADEVDELVSFLRAREADLLVIGLRQHSSHVARLWSTVSSLEQKVPCNVLAIRSLSDRPAEQHIPGDGRNQVGFQI